METAQSITMTNVENYVFGASKSAFWGNLPAETYPATLAVVSYGGGVRVIDTSVANDPQPWDSVGEDSELATQGFVRQVIVVPANGTLEPAIYCAAGVGFVARFPVDPLFNSPSYHSDPTGSSTFNAHCLATYDFDDAGTLKRYVIAGSHDGATGRISLAIENSSVTGLDHKVTYVTPSPVIALVASTEIRSGYLTVLAGTLCGGLFRFDLDPSTFNTISSFPTPSSVLLPGSAENPSPPYVSIRDLALLTTVSPPRVFVAGYSKGIYAVDLSTTSQGMTLPASGWPFTYPNQVYYCTGVSVHPGDGGGSIPDPYLFASFAGREQQVEWGNCSKSTTCGTTSRPADPSILGVRMLGGIDGSTPDEVGVWDDKGTEKTAFRQYGGVFRILAANDVEGATLLAAEPGSPDWAITATGDYGTADGIPTSSTDDLLALDQSGTQTVYGSIELGLGSHSLASGVSTLQDYEAGNCVLIQGLPNGSAGLGGVILSSALTDGIGVFDPDPSTFSPTFLGVASTNGRCYGAAITANSLDGLGLPWIYALNSLDFGVGTAALRAFRLTALSSPPSIRGISTPWQDGASRDVKFLAMRPIDATHHAAFLSYGPKAGGATHGGITMVEITYNGAANPPLTMVEKGTIRACTGPGNPCPYDEDAGPGRVILGPGNRIYCALGCNGVLMADVDSSFNVSNQAWAKLCTGTPPTQCATALGLADGLTISGTPYLVVSYLNDIDSLARGTIRLFDTSSVSTFQAGPAATFSTRFQGVGVIKDPTDAQGKTFLIAEGRGGVSKVVFGP